MHVYVLGLTLHANVNDFYKFFDTLEKCKCKHLNLTSVSVNVLHVYGLYT